MRSFVQLVLFASAVTAANIANQEGATRTLILRRVLRGLINSPGNGGRVPEARQNINLNEGFGGGGGIPGLGGFGLGGDVDACIGFNCPGKRGFGAEFDVAAGGGLGLLGGSGFGGGQAGNAVGGGGWRGRDAAFDGQAPPVQPEEDLPVRPLTPPGLLGFFSPCVGFTCG